MEKAVLAHFRMYLRGLNMADRDVDCMVRAVFPPSSGAAPPTTVIQGAELNEIATRCNVDFSRMSSKIGA